MASEVVHFETHDERLLICRRFHVVTGADILRRQDRLEETDR